MYNGKILLEKIKLLKQMKDSKLNHLKRGFFKKMSTLWNSPIFWLH